MNTQKNKITEGFSGIYPQMTLWQEFGSAVATGVFLLLPIIFHKLKTRLNDTDLVKYTSRVFELVKKDNSRGSLKSKIARAVQAVMDNPNVSTVAPVNYEQTVLNLLPNDIETKSEEEVKKHISQASERLSNREELNLPPVRTIRG